MKFLSAIILSFLTFLFGIFLADMGYLNLFSQGSLVAENSDYDAGYQAGLDSSRDILVQAFPEYDQPVGTLQGYIQSIDSDVLVLEFGAALLDPFATGSTTRQVTLSADGLTRRIEKDPAVYDQEIQEYIASNPDSPEDGNVAPPPVPLSYDLEQISLSDLKSGDLVEVYAEVDIRASDSFTATNLVLLPQ